MHFKYEEVESPGFEPQLLNAIVPTTINWVVLTRWDIIQSSNLFGTKIKLLNWKIRVYLLVNTPLHINIFLASYTQVFFGNHSVLHKQPLWLNVPLASFTHRMDNGIENDGFLSISASFDYKKEGCY